MSDSAETGGALPAGTLSVQGVSVTLGNRVILDDVSFDVAPGSFTGLIGSNGAGKTTLLRVILGLIQPTAGQVRLVGDVQQRRDPFIGYVPQKIHIEPDMPLRARDLISLGLDGNRFGLPLPNKARKRAVDEMIDAVNASSFANSRVGNLSGGEQQRVMIAHALVSRPKLLLLDEPLANLDIRSGQEVVRLLTRISTEQHIAVLMSAHDMNPLLPVMDHIIYLAGGRAASGTTGEVVTTETLSNLYGHPVEVIHVHGRVLVVSGQDDPDSPIEAPVPLANFR
jgi:zinc/manganese transport system ATP-binding protein